MYDTTSSDVRGITPERIRRLMQSNPFSGFSGDNTSPYVSPPTPPEPPVDTAAEMADAVQLDPRDARRRGARSYPVPPSLRPQSLERAVDEVWPDIKDSAVSLSPSDRGPAGGVFSGRMPPGLRAPSGEQVIDEAMPVQIPGGAGEGRDAGDLVLPKPAAPAAARSPLLDPRTGRSVGGQAAVPGEAQESVDRARGVAAAIEASRQARAEGQTLEAKKRDAEMARRNQQAQGSKAAADRRRENGLNADPQRVQESADDAVSDFAQEQANQFDPQKDLNDRLQASQTAKDTATYKAELAAYQAKFNEWQAKYNNALANDDTGEEARRLIPSMPKPPAPPPSITGGRTPQELEESVGGTLGRLPVEQQAAIRSHFVSRQLPPGVSEDDLSPEELKAYEDKGLREAEMLYADLSPEERLQEMSRDAQRISGRRDTNIPAHTAGTFGAGSGDNTRNEDLPPEELELLGKDFRNGFPSVNTPGNRGGTFVRNPNGALSARAPNPDQAAPFLDLETQPARITPQWADRMKQAGVALGLDPTKFDNEGAFLAASQTRLADYQQKITSERWTTQALPTGGFRLVPTQKTRDEKSQRELATSTNEFLGTHFGAQATPEERASMRAAAAAGKADAVRAMQRELIDRHRDTNQMAAADARKREAEVKNLNNPQRREGIRNESLRNAKTDEERANVHDVFGDHEVADDIRRRVNEGKAFEAEKAMRDAELEALKNRGSGKGDPKLQGQVNDEGYNYAVNAALGDDDVRPEQHVTNYLLARNAALREQKKPELSETDGAIELANAMARRNPQATFRSGVGGLALQAIAAEASRDAGALLDDVQGLDMSGAAGRPKRRAAFIQMAKQRIFGEQVPDETLGRWYDSNVQ
jgi:hypothetical protein